MKVLLSSYHHGVLLLQVLSLSLGFNPYYYYHTVNAAHVSASVGYIDERQMPNNNDSANVVGNYLRPIVNRITNNRRKDREQNQDQDGDTSCLSIVESICENKDWSSFCIYLKYFLSSGVDFENRLEDNDNSFTVFVPNDAAWKLVEQAIDAGLKTEKVERIINFHIYENTSLSYDELECNEVLMSHSGDTSRTKCDRSLIAPFTRSPSSSLQQTFGSVGMIKSQNGNGNNKLGLLPTIISTDLVACNGIIHGIDQVMMPVVLEKIVIPTKGDEEMDEGVNEETNEEVDAEVDEELNDEVEDEMNEEVDEEVDEEEDEEVDTDLEVDKDQDYCSMNACIHKNCYETNYYDDGYCGSAWYCTDHETYVLDDGEEEDNSCIRKGCTNDDGIVWDGDMQGWRCSYARYRDCSMTACVHKDCYETSYYEAGYCGAAFYCTDHENYVYGVDEVEDISCIREGCSNEDGIRWDDKLQGWMCSN